MTADSYRQILTPANIVTTIRIALIPLFVVVILAPWPSWFPGAAMQQSLELVKPWVAAAVFALLALTDSVDGYLARSRNEVTTLGKFLDPLADKILVAAALLALVELNELPAWVALVIITREFLVSGLRMVVSSEGHIIAASPLGKVKTVVQIIAVILFIVKANSGLAVAMGSSYAWLYYPSWVVMALAMLLTLFSMADYFYKSSKVLALPIKRGQAVLAPEKMCTLSEAVVTVAASSGMQIGTAESCTGGLIAKSITDVAGSSEVFRGGIVSYSNEVKTTSLGVGEATLKTYGAVSEQTAKEMAQGALATLGVSIAVSTTGIAGPGGGSKEKPVGTVWVGIAKRISKTRTDTGSTSNRPHDTQEAANSELAVEVTATRFIGSGNRDQIRTQATAEALSILLAHLKQR